MATLTLNDIRKRCTKFAVEWADARDERQEASAYVAALLRCFGQTGRQAALYEARVKRASTGRIGYIDALIPGLCAIEMKSLGENLERAEAQAMDYIVTLPPAETPRWIISCDFQTFRILELHDDGTRTHTTFTLTELSEKAHFLGFLAGYQTRTFGSAEQENASIKAAKLMASLYEELETSGYTDHEASIFMVRTLFCLYADDAGIWEPNIFWEFIETSTHEDGSDLGSKLDMLYQALNKCPEQRQKHLDEMIARFPYVNGGIFAERIDTPAFDAPMRDTLLEACAFNWNRISPAIFGSLFQAVKDKKARRQLGEHYTTETNILKTINPLFMDELRNRFTADYHNPTRLTALRHHLNTIRVMDPACGCGNFLIVAYRELRALDLEIFQRIQELKLVTNGGDQREFFIDYKMPVAVDHFRGIEIEEWPARIAATALQLTHHQANRAMEMALGEAPEPLPLGKETLIHVGNALRTNWNDVLPTTPSDTDSKPFTIYIVGNPPFIGQGEKKTDSQADDLKYVWGNQHHGYLDFVTAWFKKSIDYLKESPRSRFSFVSTNSISQGEPVEALFRPILDSGWRIRFAHQPFAWTTEAPGRAFVHCVITGFDKTPTKQATLYTYDTPKSQPNQHPVKTITPYLIEGTTVFVANRSEPLNTQLAPTMFGTKAVDDGNLIVTSEDYPTVAADPIAAKYLRPFKGGKELINDLPRWCLWLENCNPQDISNSAVLTARVRACRQWRSAQAPTGDAFKYRDTPHLMRPNKGRPTGPYLAIPRVFSETRHWATCQRITDDTIASDLIFTCDDPDGFAFAIISSSMFITWQKAIGGRLESRIRFANTVVWNTLPLPTVPDKLRKSIINAGNRIIEARELHPHKSLADHYNPLAMDPTLVKAHRDLDKYVDKAFGAPAKCTTNADRVKVLFKRYTELVSSQA